MTTQDTQLAQDFAQAVFDFASSQKINLLTNDMQSVIERYLAWQDLQLPKLEDQIMEEAQKNNYRLDHLLT